MDQEMPSMPLQKFKKRSRNMGPFIALAIRQHQIDIQIEYMGKYNKELEAKFKKDLNETDKYYSGQILEEKNNPEAAEDISGLCFEDKEAIYEFIRTFRHSSLVNLFSFLEVSLNKLCLIVRKEKAIDLSPDDLKHQGVTRSQVYLEKVCSVDFPSGGNDWQQIIKLNRVRNLIVHEQGVIRNKSKNPGKKTFNIVNETDGLSIERNCSIIVEENYFSKIIVNIKNLLDTAYEETRKTLKTMGERNAGN